VGEREPAGEIPSEVEGSAALKRQAIHVVNIVNFVNMWKSEKFTA
jgi:hypothetical protein